MTDLGTLDLLADASLWQQYNQLLDTQPLPTKAATAALIIGAADSVAQLLEQRRSAADADADDAELKSFDVARALRWALFGLILQGPWNHVFYLLLDSALPPTADPFTPTTFAKVFIDQGIQAPIFTVVILCYFALAEGKGLTFARAQIRDELGSILLKNWSVFVPATVINLGFCPPSLRVLFLNVVFFGWVVYLSLFLNEAQGVEKDYVGLVDAEEESS